MQSSPWMAFGLGVGFLTSLANWRGILRKWEWGLWEFKGTRYQPPPYPKARFPPRLRPTPAFIRPGYLRDPGGFYLPLNTARPFPWGGGVFFSQVGTYQLLMECKQVGTQNTQNISPSQVFRRFFQELSVTKHTVRLAELVMAYRWHQIIKSFLFWYTNKNKQTNWTDSV